MNFRELRRGMLVLANTLDKMRQSRELSIAKTAVQNSGMWAGTCLSAGKLGENPYSENDGKRIDETDIKDLFDKTSQSLSKEIVGKGLIYTVDQMREYLSKQSDALTDFVLDRYGTFLEEGEFTEKEMFEMEVAIFNLKTQLITARLWMGMELGRIKIEGVDAPQETL